MWFSQLWLKLADVHSQLTAWPMSPDLDRGARFPGAVAGPLGGEPESREWTGPSSGSLRF